MTDNITNFMLKNTKDRIFLQLTEVGELGQRGGLVQRPVGAEEGRAHDFAPTQDQLMAD